MSIEDSDTSFESNIQDVAVPGELLNKTLHKITTLEEEVSSLKKEVGELKKGALKENKTMNEFKPSNKNIEEDKLKGMFAKNVIRMEIGNILDLLKGATIAHCVATDLKMSDGLAKIIKEKYGSVTEQFRGKYQVGDIAIQEHPDRTILHMVTKESSHTTPRRRDFKATQGRRKWMQRGPNAPLESI